MAKNETWRLQVENEGHGMGIESPSSAVRGEPVVWAGGDGDLKFEDEATKALVLAAPQAAYALEEIRGHLGAALAQSLASDDQVIMQHVRDAFVLAGGKLEWLSSQRGKVSGG